MVYIYIKGNYSIGGAVKIFNERVSVKAESKVGSKDNIKHIAAGESKICYDLFKGGKVKIFDEKMSGTIKASSKVGSMDNIAHFAKPSNVKLIGVKSNGLGSKVGSMDSIASISKNNRAK